MKSIFKSVLLLMLAGGALVFAKGGLEQPPGEPPHGVAVQGDAPGTKLNGVAFVEFYDIQSDFSAKARIVLRLRKGSDFAMFYEETVVSDITSPSQVQSAIMTAMAPEVLVRFFKGAALTVKLKSMEEFGSLDTGDPVPLPDVLGRSVFVLADIVLAVR